MKRALIIAVSFGLPIACTGNEDSRTGAGEPLIVKVLPPPPAKSRVLAQFIRGKLPGTPLPALDAGAASSTGGASSVADGGPPKTLQANLTQFSERYVLQGQANVPIGGITSKDVFSVAVALENLGTGYWVVPVGPLDGNTLMPTWDIAADFGREIPQGYRNLNYVPIDSNGVAGQIQSQKICVASRVPNGYQGCLPNPHPPAAVISLSWDTNVDLDLQVQAPDGRLVESKNPATVDIDAGALNAALPADAGRIDRDSNGYCSIDGIRFENLIWQAVPPKGAFQVYVNLFDACKQPVVHFNVSVYTAAPAPGDAGVQELRSLYSADGILLDFQANGGSNRGFFVNEIVFP
jgi:hypothetical protein